jgi:hypothetical protein
MTTGLNLRGNIIRMNQQTDDSVGGAILSGTVVGNNLLMAIYSNRPTQMSLDQGLETPAIFDATVKCGIVIYERDLVEVTCPTSSPHYGLRFRVMGVQPARRTRAGEQHLTLARTRQSRRESW